MPTALSVLCLVSSAWAAHAKKLNDKEGEKKEKKEEKRKENRKKKQTKEVAFGIPASSPDPPGPAEAVSEV